MNSAKDFLFKLKEHLKVLNRSPATIKAYTGHTEDFLKTVKIDDIRKITTRMIENYIASLFDYPDKDGQTYSTNTICLKVRSIKRFFEFLEKENLIFINPTEFISEPQREKGRIKKALTPKEVATIFDQPDLSTPQGLRDRAILEVFYSTGIRREELCTLCLYDPDLQGGHIRVKGKGQKERVVPVGKEAVSFLRQYLSRIRPILAKKNKGGKYLFLNHYGEPINPQAVGRMVKKYAQNSGVKNQVTPHIFRHTFATLLIKNGADIVAVQRMLGHSDLKTTQCYIRSLGFDLKEVHQRTHPREKDREEEIKPSIERIRHPHEKE